MQKIQNSNPGTLVSSEVCNRVTTGTEICHRTLVVSFLIMLCLFLPACGRFGPRQVPRDSFNYNAAIARSSNEQMLINLVRLRYREVPVFLAVGSVLTQYFYGGELTASASLPRALFLASVRPMRQMRL